ncbi:MAG: hypothetical protein ACE5F8_01690, partial [Woeseiaceae bacterium]
VNLPAASVDYSLSGRVFETPEYLPDDITPEELEDLTKVQLPLRISGPLAAPKVGVDFQAIVKQRVQEEVEDVLRDKLRDLLDRD